MPDWTFVRFLGNGVLATVVHYAVLVVLIDVVGLPSAGLANGIASIFGITASYLGNRVFVFRSGAPVALTLPRFLAFYAIVALLHVFALGLWTDVLRLPYTPGFLIATALATVVTFLGNRFVVFRDAG